MKTASTQASPEKFAADVLAVPCWEGDDPVGAAAAALDKAMGGALSTAARSERFRGKAGESVVVHGAGRIAAGRVLLVGLGRKSRAEGPALRRAAVRAARAAQGKGARTLGFVVAKPDLARQAAEGLGLGAYRFDRYLTGDRRPTSSLEEATVIVQKAAGVAKAVEAGAAVAVLVNRARDLVNAPPNDLHPTAFAKEASALAREHKLEIRILDKKGVEKAGMKLLLAVNQGSVEEPRFIHMRYVPRGVKNPPRAVLVGKEITFDSGGLCLKTAKSMIDMKCDMSGAAVSVLAISAAAVLKVPVAVDAVVALTENMPSGNAYRPGDVFGSLDGKSVEIINTDAEGRLVLADALAYARSLQPDLIIDHATLTGACVVALGSYTAGVFSNSESDVRQYLRAADEAGEDVWRMPIVEELRDGLRSDVADIKNVGESYGGAINAALFLREFVGDSRWIHVDIAGPAFAERPFSQYPKGATGFGILALVSFLSNWRPDRARRSK